MPFPLGNLHEMETSTHWMPKAAEDWLTPVAETPHAQWIDIPHYRVYASL